MEAISVNVRLNLYCDHTCRLSRNDRCACDIARHNSYSFAIKNQSKPQCAVAVGSGRTRRSVCGMWLAGAKAQIDSSWHPHRMSDPAMCLQRSAQIEEWHAQQWGTLDGVLHDQSDSDELH